jgi:hypothetical protein
MKVAHRLFEPSTPALPDTVITIGNTIGNSVEGNGGDKARFLSQLLNMRVCAYQRPGTGSDAPIPSHRPSGDRFLKHAGDVAELLNDKLSEEGAEHVIVASHSADGPFGLAMVISDRMPVAAYAGSDLVGVRRVSSLGGFVRWATYQHFKRKPGHPSPDTPTEWKAPPEISGGNVRKEMRLNHKIWREPVIVDGLRHIANYMPRVAVQVVFPERSFNGDPGFMQQTAVDLNALGASRRPGDSSYFVGFEAGRAHRHYDDPRYFGGIVVDVLASLGHQPETFVHEMYREPTFRHIEVSG